MGINASIYTKKIQVTRGIFHGIPLIRKNYILTILYHAIENTKASTINATLRAEVSSIFLINTNEHTRIRAWAYEYTRTGIRVFRVYFGSLISEWYCRSVGKRKINRSRKIEETLYPSHSVCMWNWFTQCEQKLDRCNIMILNTTQQKLRGDLNGSSHLG